MNHPGAHPREDQKQEQPSSIPRSNCKLELLPTEVLVAILSDARSTTDLHALIHASPRLYQVFVAVKRKVLLSIVATGFGHGLRDAVAVVLITPTKLRYQEPTYLEEYERVIHRYEALPHSYAELTSASRLAMDTVVVLARLNHTVQFFVDEFAASRLPELYNIHPGAANPLTTTERHRLAQALLRHQILARIEPGSGPRPPDHASREMAMMHRFLALFRLWETEQLAQTHTFLASLVTYAIPRQPITAQTLPRTPQDRQSDDAIYDLDMLRRALATDPGPNGSRLPRLDALRQAGPVLAAPFYWFLHAGPLPMRMPEGAWRRVPREFRALRDALYRREDALPRLVAATDNYNGDNGNDDDAAPPAPPFGWVDAHGGLDCQRWGNQVRREAPGDGEDHSTAFQREWTRVSVNRWRWHGFVFWDRVRVEMLKTPTPKRANETGWLAAAIPSNEELQKRL